MITADYLKPASHLLGEHHKTLNLEKPRCCFASVAQLGDYTEGPKKYWLHYHLVGPVRLMARCVRHWPRTRLDVVCPEQWSVWTGNTEERGGSDKFNLCSGQASGGQPHPCSLKSHDQWSNSGKIQVLPLCSPPSSTPLFWSCKTGTLFSSWVML